MADLATCSPLTRQSAVEAHALIHDKIHRTPVLTSTYLNELASSPRDGSSIKPNIRMYFKCENLQKIGAFKARGAFHAVEKLKKDPSFVDADGMKKGVVTFSAGNHAQAVALAARESGIPAYIVMPETSSAVKIKSVEGYGAKLTLSKRFEREIVAQRIIDETGARLIPPYDHPDIILGQATCGLELQEQVEKKLDAIISPTSGGGLLSGTALSCEGTGTRVYGAEPEFEGADDGRRGFLSGERITHVASSTIADGLIGKLGEHPWEIIYKRKLVAMLYAVSEEEILSAMKLVYERLKLVVEPAAVVGLATALYNEEFRALVQREAGEAGWDIGVILSGGNIGTERIGRLFTEGVYHE